ncbi:flagellar motor protein MotB [Sediminimonas sp.]|uniref:flagellar motor protein MotB n=1 Tax=Sediminimonas sp. TaxID=2823379 RepID=UPI0025FB72D1|nr:flagellar motor protein MotB [Sediminimonas sp.]
MGTQPNAPPVIIKRKKIIAGGGHHGGAWKVAYADFVTAMMAFFMLMWLLNATTEKQRKGLADYFSPTIATNRISGGGDAMLQGETLLSADTQLRMGSGSDGTRKLASPASRPSQDRAAEDENLARVEMALEGLGGESMVRENALRHVVTRRTDAGLVIELFDLPGAVLFEPEIDAPTPLLEELAQMLARVMALVENRVALVGHVRAVPVVRMDYPGWGLSFARADALRRLMERHGLDPRRAERLTGGAAARPAVSDPMSPRNNRLELILLREKGV